MQQYDILDDYEETKKVLDCRYTLSTFDQFENVCQYAPFYRACLQKAPVTPDQPFENHTRVNALSYDTADKVRNMLDSDQEGLKASDFRMGLLREILDTYGVKSLIYGYFESEFMPVWLRFYKNEPADDARPPSFYWHCDGGPVKHLKLLLYCNPTAESGGNTWVIDKYDTEKFKVAGYVFSPITHRLSNLAELADDFSISYKEHEYDLDTGQGLLFEPANNLHKGIWPSKAPRYFIQIMFMPAPMHWEQACEQWQLPWASNDFPKLQVGR